MNEIREPGKTDADGDEQAFARWLRAGLLPEVRKGVQRRSERTAYALLQAGLALLRTTAFDALPIERICAEAGATVGAFYGRFDDKHAFFSTMQRLTCLRSEAALAEFVGRLGARPPTLERTCRLVVEITVERYRANVGIYRAALQHAGEGAWAPFRRLGDRWRAALTGLLSPLLTQVPPKDRATRIQFAYQVLVGTLVHATLNDPGPMHLHDDALERELTRMLLRYLAGGRRG